MIPANLTPLMALIRRVEARSNYDIVYFGSKIKTPKPITTMTIAEVRDWQERSVKAGSKSSAVGAYQIIRKTLDAIMRAGVAKPGDKFDKDTQDKMALYLLKQRGLERYQAGNMTAADFANRIAMEWASFPVIGGPKHGRSYYAGDGLNKALVSPEDALNAVMDIRSIRPAPAPTGWLWSLVLKVWGFITRQRKGV